MGNQAIKKALKSKNLEGVKLIKVSLDVFQTISNGKSLSGKYYWDSIPIQPDKRLKSNTILLIPLKVIAQ